MGSGLLEYLEKNYSYYNAPEGEDPVGKIVGLGKYGFFAGGFIGIYDAVLWSHCRNTLQFLNTAAYWVVPMTGICVTFSAVTYTLTNLRKKDDKWNYFAGCKLVVSCWIFLKIFLILSQSKKQCFFFKGVIHFLFSFSALAASAVLYAWRRQIRMDAWFGIAMTSYALIKKTNIQDGRGSQVFVPKDDPAVIRKWLLPWRNVPYRNYTNKPWWPHDRTDYYINHY